MIGDVALLHTTHGWLVGWGGISADFGEPDDLRRRGWRFYFAPIEDEL
jgi:hypothetical protein